MHVIYQKDDKKVLMFGESNYVPPIGSTIRIEEIDYVVNRVLTMPAVDKTREHRPILREVVKVYVVDPTEPPELPPVGIIKPAPKRPWWFIRG